MEETKMQHVNTFKVIGKLVKADVKLGTSTKTGQPYASVKTFVQSVINGETKEFEIDFYSSQLTGAGKVSSLYTTYSKLGDMEGKRVEITSSIRENRYFSSSLNQIISTQELAGRFIRVAPEAAEDVATWEMSGFVAKILQERVNKKEEVYRYDLTLAQANYSGSAISMFTLHVNPARRDIITGVEAYEAGQTVKLNGILDFKVETVTTEAKNDGGFGKGVVRTYTNRTKNFFIEGGSAPIKDDTKYDGMAISELISAYKARDVELADKGRTSTQSVETTPTITKKQTSLI